MIKGFFGNFFGNKRTFRTRNLYGQESEKNMKNKRMSLIDKILLLKRELIESVFGKIKLLGKFEHSRHRSVTNAFVHMVVALTSYQLSDNKLSIKSLLKLQDF
jgi:hypothetical protein